MGKLVGFEETLKTVISLDTLIVCILSLILVKIMKDEFADEGYQRLDHPNIQPTPLSNLSTNTTFADT
jgi:hypothetical protein